MTAPTKRPARPRPWEQGSAEAASFGRWLRRQREVRKIALREVAETTNISIRYLEALEDDRFDALPAPVFAKGFLREYARYVGLDPDEVVNNYLDARHDATADEAQRVAEADGERDRHRRGRALGVWAVALAVIALLAAAFWAYRSGILRRQAAPSPPPLTTAVPVAPAPAAMPPPPATPDAPLRVTLDFTADSWVEVAIDGERSFSELRVQGESLQLKAQQEVVVSVTNAAGVHVEVNGRVLPLAPGVDGAVKDLRIDLATAAPPSPAL